VGLSHHQWIAVRTTACVTLAATAMSFTLIWVWMQIDPVMTIHRAYLAATIIPLMISPVCSMVIQRAHVQVRELSDENQYLANHDELTGLSNRRAFFTRAKVLQANAEPGRQVFACAIADIDDFKRICEADSKGTGDFAVRQVGQLFQKAMQSGDLVARLDGNRFAFLINSSDEQEIMRAVERLRGAATSKPLVNPKTGRAIGNPTLSIGIVMSILAEGAGELMAHAEKAMAASSREGGDRVTFYSDTEHAATTSGWMIYRP